MRVRVAHGEIDDVAVVTEARRSSTDLIARRDERDAVGGSVGAKRCDEAATASIEAVRETKSTRRHGPADECELAVAAKRRCAETEAAEQRVIDGDLARRFDAVAVQVDDEETAVGATGVRLAKVEHGVVLAADRLFVARLCTRAAVDARRVACVAKVRLRRDALLLGNVAKFLLVVRPCNVAQITVVVKADE